MDTTYMSVAELTKIIKDNFDNNTFFNRVYIKGEISNFKRQVPSGHCYFTIKDEYSKISSVMFSSKASKMLFEPKDGDSVLVIGKVSVYEPNGNYQLYVDEMSNDGAGELYKKFLELKKELAQEGLFDEFKKKSIPRFPKRIGIVTASTGAAIRDILNTINRRYPLCETILFPSLVQGSGAADDIEKNIKESEKYNLDVLIVGRGGGSIEDLWPFNEKKVAYAIYNCTIPVISAVGHQIDYTISDFVADVRAATPTAAAELAVPNIMDISLDIDSKVNRLTNYIKTKIVNYNNYINSLLSSYIIKNPRKIYEIKDNNVNNLKERLINSIYNIISENNYKYNIIMSSYIIRNPRKIYESKKENVNKYLDRLEILNPLSSLKRGYCILKKNNKSINTIKNIKNNDVIDIKLVDGVVNASVKNIKEEL
ncbi:MAG: exodeoxyribonuclease VII large subunit [Bacilli bacterium]|nr:exodeoxyribonuclease VII large subunit [Bacilli bacterium]